jgi:glucose dehydrogenase
MTLTINGTKRDVVTHINKNAYYFVLDNKTGRPVHPTPEVPVPQNARAHTFPTQPIPQDTTEELVPHVAPFPKDYEGVIAPDGKPYKIPTTAYEPYTDEQYVVFSPTANGGVQWMNGSFDPTTGFEVVCTNVQSYALEAPPAADQKPVISNAGAIIQWRTSTTPNSTSISRLIAFNPATNKIVWKFDELSTGGIARGNKLPCNSNITTTANGLTLRGTTIATPNAPNGSGFIQAFSTRTGALLWQKEVLVNGGPAAVVPRLSTYSVGGKQYLVSFVHSTALGADITAFTLP